MTEAASTESRAEGTGQAPKHLFSHDLNLQLWWSHSLHYFFWMEQLASLGFHYSDDTGHREGDEDVGPTRGEDRRRLPQEDQEGHLRQRGTGKLPPHPTEG